MIKNNTVVVVAAGASHDLGLPLGPDLKKRVADLLRDQGELSRYLAGAAHHNFKELNRSEVDRLLQQGRQFASQIESAASIDNFLDQHQSDARLVAYLKMVIAYALAEAENASQIAGIESPEEIITKTNDYFLYDFLNIVVRGHQAENIGESLNNLTFIIFNYDRCVERYIDIWMKFRFGNEFSWRESGPKFIHVYGSLGDYFDQGVYNPFEYEGRFAFQNPHMALPNYVSRIKVFTEQEESEISDNIRHAVSVAKSIVFFGFGFEEQNMRFFNGSYNDKTVFATLYGMSPTNTQHLQQILAERFSRNESCVHTVNGKSRKLISDCYFPLTKAVGSL